ncbi:Transcription regulator, AsnC-type [Mycolicibacterium rhodesiae JS60]|nr:Transcription regulator, AsnC-type [Mycolicibacterium rhodesiae JS60]
MADAHISLRELAVIAGVTNETVTARLRRLREANVLATTVLIDAAAAGYAASAVVRIKAPRPALRVLVGECAASPGCGFLSAAMGACDLVMVLLGVDLEDVRSTLRAATRGICDIRAVEIDVVTSVLAYDLGSLTLPIRPWPADRLPSPRPSLDDLDCALLAELTASGHESNREIARRLNVSDVTVRARTRRLEQGGLIRVVAGVDPVAAGDRQLFGMVFVRLDDESVLPSLTERSIVVTAVKTLGAADLVLQIGGQSVLELTDFVSELANLRGVRGLDVCYLTDVLLHQNHLARFG